MKNFNIIGFIFVLTCVFPHEVISQIKLSASQKAIFANIENNMVNVTGGTFMNEVDYGGTKTCEIQLDDFSINKYELTNQEWISIFGKDHPAVKGTSCLECPVENISWIDAQKFLIGLNKFTGKHYRMPTAAEWEFAARGGMSQDEFHLSGGTNINEVAVISENGNQNTRPVGSKKPNSLDIFDMTGNVAELCYDVSSRYYCEETLVNPTGDKYGRRKTLKGGSVKNINIDMSFRIDHRSSIWKEERLAGVGLRLASGNFPENLPNGNIVEVDKTIIGSYQMESIETGEDQYTSYYFDLDESNKGWITHKMSISDGQIQFMFECPIEYFMEGNKLVIVYKKFEDLYFYRPTKFPDEAIKAKFIKDVKAGFEGKMVAFDLDEYTFDEIVLENKQSLKRVNSGTGKSYFYSQKLIWENTSEYEWGEVIDIRK